MIRCKSKSYAYLHHIIHYNQLSSLLFNQLAENLLKLNIKILAVVYSKSLHTALTVNQHKTFSSLWFIVFQSIYCMLRLKC